MRIAGKRGKENKKDEGTTDFKKQTLFISHRILCRDECDGSGVGGEQTVGTLFFLLTDCLDNRNGHNYDCDGTRQSLWWKEC